MGIHLLSALAISFVVAAGQPAPPLTILASPTEEALVQAFPGVDFSGSSTKLQFSSESVMVVVAASGVQVQADGRLKLTDFAVAIYPKAKKEDAGLPTSARSAYALVKFDRPVRELKECVERKLVSVELPGGLEVRIPGQ